MNKITIDRRERVFLIAAIAALAIVVFMLVDVIYMIQTPDIHVPVISKTYTPAQLAFKSDDWVVIVRSPDGITKIEVTPEEWFKLEVGDMIYIHQGIGYMTGLGYPWTIE